MFEVLIVKPIFNLLVLIYALLPGHNFGLALIVFTVVVRILMWPIVKKQLHQTKAMRALQPELKKIKQAAKGDRQKESLMQMELYKERGINPFSSIGTLIVQLIIFIGLYSGLKRVVDNPQAIVEYSYGWVQDLSWLRSLAADMGQFDDTLFGVVDLSRAALNKGGGIYWPAMLLVIGSAVSQFFQSKQLMPNDKDSRSLRQIMKDASEGKQADASETNAAVGRSMRYFIPIMIFVFTVGLPSALSLYWFVGGLVAYWQQSRVLSQDSSELHDLAGKGSSSIIEGEVINEKKPVSKKPKPKKSSKSKRRKK